MLISMPDKEITGTIKEKFEYTKEVITSHKSKDRQYTEN
jgi:hypothetical protein